METGGKETLSKEDSRGFIYQLTVTYFPNVGYAHIEYQNIMEQTNLNRLFEPVTDDDAAWDRYNEMYEVWKDEAKSRLIPEIMKKLEEL